VIAGSIVTGDVAMLQNANYFAVLAVIADRRGMRIKQPAPTISEPMTWEQICQRYPDEWVCLVEIEWLHRSNFEFRTARVVGNGKARREPLVQARPWREHYRTIGHFHTAPLRPVAEPVLHFIRVDIPCGMPRFYPCTEAEAEAFEAKVRLRRARGGAA
jgi:hypothetical protein